MSAVTAVPEVFKGFYSAYYLILLIVTGKIICNLLDIELEPNLKHWLTSSYSQV